MKLGPRGRQQTFKGGPRGASNPTRELLKEASTIFGRDKLVAQIVSLGCGHLHISSIEMDPETEAAARSVQEMATDCEAVAKELSTRLCDMDEYLRLNVERGLEHVLMNEWDDLGSVETHTSAYIETAEILQAIEASLRRLQGSTGTVTLGEISACPHIGLEVLCKAYSLMSIRPTEDRQGRAGQARYAKRETGPYL